MAYRSNEPYNDLPLLPPPAIETTRVLRRCIAASRALAELKGAGNLIPNQSILINSIPLQEARLISEIENIVTTQDALFRAAAEEPGRADPQTREVLRYRTALRHVSSLVDAGLGRRETASEYLRELERIGVLQREKHGREVLYRHPALLEVLQG